MKIRFRKVTGYWLTLIPLVFLIESALTFSLSTSTQQAHAAPADPLVGLGDGSNTNPTAFPLNGTVCSLA
jgi:hypothetical protein